MCNAAEDNGKCESNRSAMLGNRYIAFRASRQVLCRMYRDTDPTHWKLLIFYYNLLKTRLFVPNRRGLLFTINFANPAAWIMTGIIVAVIAGAAALNN